MLLLPMQVLCGSESIYVKWLTDNHNSTGIGGYNGPLVSVSSSTVLEHLRVNAIGTLVLFQAVYPLMLESTPNPKFIPISSASGSVASISKLPQGYAAYGASKAALNFIVRTLRFENENLSTPLSNSTPYLDC
jgi:norsolorinic acid ketoreductase